MSLFNVNKLEYLCYRHQHEAAGRELIDLLQRLEEHYGHLVDIDEWVQSSEAASRDIMNDQLRYRLISAITSLVTDPGFAFSEEDVKHVMGYQRWLTVLFGSSAFVNADHILRSLGLNEMARTNISVPKRDLRKFLLFYTPESEVCINWDTLWDYDKNLTASLAFALLSARLLATPAAHHKREMLLRWLPSRLDQIDSLDVLPTVLQQVNMLCSYADYPGKHDIKKPINSLIRRKLKTLNLFDSTRKAQLPAPRKKPVLLVVLEWFSKNHSIYRTHSQTMASMRERFHVVGMGYNSRVDDTGRAIFDEFIGLKGNSVWDQVRHVRETSEALQAQVMYMPSVGMFPITIILACLRMAPLQIMALGHPATTHGHAMDYVVVEDDYVGDEKCFSEKLLRLPSDGMPYRPSAALLSLELPPKKEKISKTVKIAVAATIIKLNPGFFEMCRRIADNAGVPVEFHFLAGQARGLVYPQLRNLVRRYMGNHGILHGDQNYANYVRTIASCDMFLNPFPFGNTNGIVDTVWAGLVGICKTGREVHEHIDEGMFRRLGFPEWTITRTNEEYYESALRMIRNPDERNELAARLTGPQAINKLIFTGRPEILGQRIEQLWLETVGTETATLQI
jgi:hypothetical protein